MQQKDVDLASVELLVLHAGAITAWRCTKLGSITLIVSNAQAVPSWKCPTHADQNLRCRQVNPPQDRVRGVSLVCSQKLTTCVKTERMPQITILTPCKIATSTMLTIIQLKSFAKMWQAHVLSQIMPRVAARLLFLVASCRIAAAPLIAGLAAPLAFLAGGFSAS